MFARLTSPFALAVIEQCFWVALRNQHVEVPAFSG